MPIENAIERNGFVYVYDENGFQLATILGQLCRHTESTVSVRRDGLPGHAC
jgi:hypothetical protein